MKWSIEHNHVKMRWKFFLILVIFSIIPIVIVTLLLTRNMFNYLENQTYDMFRSLVDQASINVQFMQTKYEKELKDLVNNNEFLQIIDTNFENKLTEIEQDEILGKILRDNIGKVIDGDILLLQFNKYSFIDETAYKVRSYTRGGYSIDFDNLVNDNSYKQIIDENIKDSVLTIFDSSVISGYEVDLRPVMLYPVWDKDDLIGLIMIILTKDQLYNLYRQMNKLRLGTLYIIDRYERILSKNHPVSDDYFIFDSDIGNYIYHKDLGSYDRNNNMTLEDYQILITGNDIFDNQEISGFIKDNYDNYKKINFTTINSTKYLTIFTKDNRNQFYLLFLLPDNHISKPIKDVLRAIVMITVTIIFILLGLMFFLNHFFLKPFESATEAIQQRNLYFMNLAHEIKTPLTLIKNFLERYFQKVEVTEELKIIKQNIDKLEKDMINILDVRKLELGVDSYDHNQVTNISKMITQKKNLFEEMAYRKKIKISFELDDDCYVRIDPLALDRVINNLIDNALKYSKGETYVSVVLKSYKERVTLEVKDQGIGIDRKDLKKIFRPYSQVGGKKTMGQGVGLGLYVVNRIISGLKAQISVQSEINKGTTFTIRFKKELSPDNFTENEHLYSSGSFSQDFIMKEMEESKFQAGRQNILIIEDNLDLLYYLKTSMEENYNVFYASNGREAKEKLENMKKPDLILSDIMMEEMNGFEFLEFANNSSRLRDIPIIFLSAVENPEEKIKAYDTGAVDFVNKPFSTNELIAKIDSLLKFQQLKKQLYENDKYATLGMLLGGISHEIFNPLLGIYAPLENLDMLYEKIEIPQDKKEKIVKFTDNIKNSVRRIEEIVKSLKILYYNKQMDKDIIQVETIIASIIEIFRNKIKGRIEIEYDLMKDFEIVGNHSAFSQILLNLIGNAIDAIDDEGVIYIKTGKNKNRLYLKVIDDGAGIPEEDFDIIFNAFFTTKEIGKGTGLGLYLVKDLVMRMGWDIEVSSRVGEGTTFTILF